MAEKAGQMQVDIALVRQLAKLLNDTGLTEIEVEADDRKIRVARTMQGASVTRRATRRRQPFEARGSGNARVRKSAGAGRG